jgi:hypothetical protein
MKKINLIKVALLFVSVVTLVSCSSDGGGESNGTTTGNYFPMAIGNKWNYTDGSINTEVNLIGTTVFYPNDTYYEMTDTGDEFNIQNWVAKKGATYFQRAGTTTITQGSTTIVIQPYEILLFKDNLDVNQGWVSSGNQLQVSYTSPSGSGTLPATLDYECLITERGASETLGGITYNNIIKMEMDAVETVNSQITNIHSEYWFAKDIGLVRESITSSTDNVTKTRYLTSYQLN